ncbi:hypothetical protein [Streptomyces sp. NPDC046759]|uniref:hypothetical protein n=1 Tax=Streptomyces sp. NPDC046759 TaxID=3155019 RepID=UPI003409E489
MVTALAAADGRQPVLSGAVTTAAPEPAVPATTSAAAGPPAAPAPAIHTKASPFATLLIGNRLLHLPGTEKEVRQFPGRASAADWAGVLEHSQPRLYSMSFSPLTHPSEVRLTVCVVR